jgi:sulfur carrier protein
MVLFVNGETLKSDAKNIAELIKELEIENKVMAAAVNMNIVKKYDWDKFLLQDNDKVEFLRFVAGG